MTTAREQPPFLADRLLPYCRRCGHGIVAQPLNEALLVLGLGASQVVLTTDIGCVGLVDPLFPGVHTVHTYPVTVGSGFSLSEVKLAPEPIVYAGIDAPDAMLVTSGDGLREIRSRGDLARLAPRATVVADESVAADLVAPNVLALPLRRHLSTESVALGAVAALNARVPLLDPDALTVALDAVGLGDAALRRAVTDGPA